MFHVRLRRICIVLMMAILFLNICQFYSVIQTCISLMIFYLIPLSIVTFFFFFLEDIIYLFLERGREEERGRDTSMCGCLLCAPYWGRGLRPRHVPWLSIELVTLWFAGWHSIHWATPARAYDYFYSSLVDMFFLIFRERGRAGGYGEKEHQCEKYISWLPPVCIPVEIESTT